MKNPIRKWTEKLDGKWENILVCLSEVIVGILVLIRPMKFTAGIIVVAGIVCVAMGIKFGFKYFTTSIVEESIQRALFKGLLFAGGGLFLIVRSGWLARSLTVLTIVYGIALLVMSAEKIQWAADQKRWQKVYWYLPGVSALIGLLLAVIVLINPFSSSTAFWIVLGISLFIEAGVDGATLYMPMRKKPETILEKPADVNIQKVAEEPEEEIDFSGPSET